MNLHITQNGQQLGPYTLEQAHSLLAAGTLRPTDWAWYEGLADWIPLQQVPGLAPAPVPHLAPATTVLAPAAVSPVAATPSRRPGLVWTICLLYFILIPLGFLSLAATPYLLPHSSIIMRQAEASLQTQLNNTTDPAERDRLIVAQNQLRDGETQMAQAVHHGVFYYGYAVFSMLVNLVAAILLFLLRRSAFPAFMAALLVSILGAIYNWATLSWPHIGPGQMVGIVVGIVAAVIYWGILLAVILYTRHLSRAGILR